MSMLTHIILTCKNATLLMSKEQEHVISFKEKIQMHLHLLFCKVCSLFYKQSNHIHAAVKQLSVEENAGDLIELDEAQRTSLQAIIDKEIRS